jgi:hypothetical protein
MTAPTAEIIGVRHYGGIRTARIMCPYCARTHLHRHPLGDSGVHTAHCGLGHYRIEPTGPPSTRTRQP